VHEFHPQAVNRGDGACDSAQDRCEPGVKLLAKFVGSHKPRFAHLY